jgi:hypothetical protein
MIRRVPGPGETPEDVENPHAKDLVFHSAKNALS